MRQHELEHRVAERTAALTEAQHELMKQERFSAIGQLAASVAHELRNPLGAGQEHRAHDPTKSRSTQQIDVVRPIRPRSSAACRAASASSRICWIMFMSASRSAAPSISSSGSSECLDGQALPAGVALARDFAAPDAVIAIDAGRLPLAIANVVDNAMQAIMDYPDGQPAGTITIATAIADERLTLSIADTGLGITPKTCRGF